MNEYNYPSASVDPDFTTSDTRFRLEALDLAIKHNGGQHVSADMIVSDAEEFFKFLRDGANVQ